MKKKNYIIFLNFCASFLMALIFVPLVTYGVTTVQNDTSMQVALYPIFGDPAPNSANSGDPAANPTNSGDPAPNPTNNGDPAPNSGWLKNPLAFDGICGLLVALVNLATEIGAIVGVLALIWTGFLFVVARGNPEKLKFAKSVLKSTLIGIFMLLGAALISKVILGTIAAVIGSAGSCG